MPRTLDQIIASQRTVEELERLLRAAPRPRPYIATRDGIPCSPDAPGEEPAARRDR